MIKKIQYLLLIALVFVTGCSYNHSLKVEDAAYSKQVFPPVYLIVRPPGDYVTNGQLEYANEFTYELSKRNKFKAFTNYTGSPYTLDIVYGGMDTRSHPQLIWWVITAASLFIIPHQFEAEFTMNAKIYRNNELIKKYEYKDTLTGWASLFNTPRSEMSDMHGQLADRLLNDLERDNLFTNAIYTKKAKSI